MSKDLNLIPGSGKEFRDKEYWERFFKIRGNKAFEWYGEYENLCHVIHHYIKMSDRILMIGCGNSKLSENLYDVGMRNIVNIDISNVVIQQMSAKNRQRKEMQFLKMDMLQMEFESNSFDSILDKGTLDALMSDSSPKAYEDADRLFNEIDRVLKVGGRYMCVSLAQNHILSCLLSAFTNRGWFIRIHRIDEQDLDFYLPVFVFVFTKMKMAISTSNPIIELKFDVNSDKFIRTNSIDEAKARIKEFQNYGLIKFHISNHDLDLQDEVFVHLYDASNQKYPRFTIFILDNPSKNKMNGVFGAFVVPIGKELEWHFGTKLGREELVAQAKYQRLAIIYLNRAHHYENLDSILSELSPKIIELSPKGLPKGYKIPMLSLGADLDLRDVKFQGSSKMSGDFYVEDVTPSDQSEPTRRLVFQSIIPTVQTEVILKSESSKNKKNKKKIETNLKPSYDSFLEDYFSMILSQLCSLKLEQSRLNILLIGLGGGALAMYCKTWLKDCHIDAIEIDEEIAKVAKDWFGLVEDKNINIEIKDGLAFIREAAKEGKKWDVVIIDVNSNDPESELWVPTYDFVELEFLNQCKEITDGLFVLNMICLSAALKQKILERLAAIWNSVFLNKLDKNRNEVLFCSRANTKSEVFLEKPCADLKTVNQCAHGNTVLMLEEVASSLKEIKI